MLITTCINRTNKQVTRTGNRAPRETKVGARKAQTRQAVRQTTSQVVGGIAKPT